MRPILILLALLVPASTLAQPADLANPYNPDGSKPKAAPHVAKRALGDLKNPFPDPTGATGSPPAAKGAATPASPVRVADAGSGAGSAPAAGGAASGTAGTSASGTSASGSAPSTTDAPATGSAAAPTPATTPAGAPAGQRSTAELRQICAEALNADPTFAESIAKTISEDTERQHLHAADAIAKNEKHVILAYAAMWLVAAGFVLFLWRRQQALRTEIVQLRRDLDVAAK